MSKVSRLSENEDDPEVYESSGDEWNSSSEKKSNSRRSSQRLSKKPRIPIVEEASSSEESSDSEDSDEEPKRKKSKNGWNKKQNTKVVSNSNSNSNATTNSNSNSSPPTVTNSPPSSDSSKPVSAVAVPVSRGIHRKFIPKTIYSEDYATGSFVILKKDAQVGDPSKHPCIWRIDGKALLQKYEAYDEDGKVRHKNTSVYTGWSPMDKDLYAPITVDVINHNNQNLTVELHWDKLKEVNIDSD